MRAAYAGGVVTVSLLALALSACGKDDGHEIVVRIGDRAITKATVDRWTRIVEHGGTFTGFGGEPRGGTAQRRALAMLISSNWLIGEAARESLPVSAEALSNSLILRKQEEGESRFRERLRRTGQTLSGLELELRAELALEAIRQELSDRIDRVAPSEIEAYYHNHRHQFRTPEMRVIDIIENLPSARSVRALVRRIGTGKRFTRLAYHKQMALTPGLLKGESTKKQVDYAIFAARPGEVSQPMRLFGRWSVFIVRRLIPGRPQSLAAVRSTVVAELTEEREIAITRAFGIAYQKRWRAKTMCLHKYLAPGCAGYDGLIGPYENPFARK